MKTFYLLIAILVTGTLSAQNAFLIQSDTLKGADTLEFRSTSLTRTDLFIGIQASIDYIANSSDQDSIHAMVSVDGIDYARVNPANGSIVTFPDANMSLDDNTPMIIGVSGFPFPNWGFDAHGVAGDTVVINTYGITKR